MIAPIPAIDLLNGNCVRLMQGAYDQVTTYHNDPIGYGTPMGVIGSRIPACRGPGCGTIGWPQLTIPQ